MDGQWGTERWARKEELLYTRGVLHTNRSRAIDLIMEPGNAGSINDLNVAGVFLGDVQTWLQKTVGLKSHQPDLARWFAAIEI